MDNDFDLGNTIHRILAPDEQRAKALRLLAYIIAKHHFRISSQVVDPEDAGELASRPEGKPGGWEGG